MSGLQWYSILVPICDVSLCQTWLRLLSQEVLGYLSVLLALRPEEKQSPISGPSHDVHSGLSTMEQAQKSAAAAVVLQLDVTMEAPVIITPRCSDSDDKVCSRASVRSRACEAVIPQS